MKWKKLGKIFDPTKHRLPSDCVDFAQSPQTCIFDDFIRIYFSTRQKDDSGKYLSHIAYVDFKHDLTTIVNVSTKPVINLGELGCYDEHGIFPLNILQDEARILGFIGGWNRRVSVPIDGSIGLSESLDNGQTFTRIGNGPVLSLTPDEPFLIGDPFVAKYSNQYHMWYIYGLEWIAGPNHQPERIYKIGHAVSSDGINWVKQGKQIIKDVLNSNECQALPTVIKIDQTHHMLFCFRQALDFRKNKHSAYRIGHAYSTDLLNWTRDDLSGIDVTEGNWDSDMLCYPHLFRLHNQIYLLYNGNEFGRFGFGLAQLIYDK